jgi:glycosyltransferase involved in cell wall biosynthesis
MPSPTSIDVVFPCLNEAEALPWVLRRIPTGYRAIVVDNGSVDGSADIAAELGARVVVESRHGFGAAAHTGLLAATADIVCFCDADASMDPQELPTLVGPVQAGESDLHLGRRRPVPARAWPPHARVANAVLAGRLRRTTGIPLHDLGPMRAAHRTALLDLDLQDRRSGYPLEMILRAHRAGWRIGETSIHYRPRIGRSKVTGTIRGTLQAVHDMGIQLRAT